MHTRIIVLLSGCIKYTLNVHINVTTAKNVGRSQFFHKYMRVIVTDEPDEDME